MKPMFARRPAHEAASSPRGRPTLAARRAHSTWIVGVCLALVAGAARAEVPPVEQALATGDYAAATHQLESAHGPQADLQRVALWLVTGRYDQAAALAERLAAGASGVEDRARLLGARAHFARGRHGKARKLLAPRVAQGDPEALDWDARAATASGDHVAAMRNHRQLIEAFNRGRAKDARALMAVARAAWMLGAFKDANRAFTAATRADPQDVDIQLAWGDLFASKFAAAQTAACLRDALEINPHHPQVLERKARLEYEHRLEFAAAEALLGEALATNPNLTAAHVTHAAIALRDHELDDALTHVKRALEVNPRDLEALSLKAAIHFVGDERQAFEQAKRAVLAVDRRFSQMYSIIARYAEWEHRYADLVKLADQALRLDPNDAMAHATRGLNLLRLGREEEGLAALQQAWRRDRYNRRVYNTLNLYDDVIHKHYVDFADGRYRLRMHRDERVFLEPYVGPLLKEGFASLAPRYGIEPKAPLYFEIYASAEDFSVRTTGMPRVGVQGVCFGKLVTAISPGATHVNWAQILWHEQAHIFHIQLSNDRVPRWFTEGLAEYETIIARPEWQREDDDALLDALESGDMPSVRSLNHAFTHARSPEEVMVAYYASSRVVGYLVERYGFERVPALLRGWADGSSTEAVFRKVLGLELEDLDADFRAHELARLAPLRAQYRVRESEYADLAKWQQRAKADPSADAEAGLAVALLVGGRPPQAVSQAKRVLKRDPNHTLALWALAVAGFRDHQLDDARAAVTALLAAGTESYELRMLEARLAIQRKDFDGARASIERAIELSPREAESYVALGVIADATLDLELRADAALALARIDQHAAAPMLLALPLLADEERFEELAALFDHGKNVMPQSSLLHRFGARAQHGLGHAEQALVLATRALALAHTPEEEATALIEKARALTALGRTGPAEAAAARARSLMPALADAATRALSR